MAGQPGRSGGPRTGAPGKAYTHRIDLHKPTVAPGQPYGQAGQQQAALRAVPMGTAQPTPAGPPPGLAQAQGGPEPVIPPVVPLDAPTQNPAEPVTAGMPFGPGPGPSPVIAAPSPVDNQRAWLQSVYSVAPNNDLLELIMGIQ